MTGLLIIGVYCFFWWFCWKISGLFGLSTSIEKKIGRIVLFLLIAAAPYYYYLYEKLQYDAACDTVEVFFPEEKIDFPESFILNITSKGNTERSFHFGWIVDYLIKPVDSVEIKFDKGISQFKEFSVYPFEGKSLANSEYDKKRIKSNARFGSFFESKSFNDRVSISTTFIYDFKENKRISSYSTVGYFRGLHTIEHYVFPVDFKYCQYKNDNFKDFDFKTKTLLEQTFKHRDKRN